MDIIDVERIKSAVRYEPNTGHIVRVAGRKAGCIAASRNTYGYVQVKIGPKSYAGHRLAWLLYYGEWPAGTIDHINGVKDDNRIENIRLADKAQQCWNKSAPSHNTSGVKGVHWRKRYRKWQARIKKHGKRISLGHYLDIAEAAKKYDEAATELFGVFANINGELHEDVIRRAGIISRGMLDI